MKRLLLALFLLVLPALAQVGPISITSTQCATIGVSPSTAVIGVQVTGTWTGTLQPQGTVQGQTAFNVQVTPSTSSTAQSTITGNGGFLALVAGYSTFQVCGATVATGTANVFLNVSNAPAGSGTGGGTTVTLQTNGVNNSSQTGLNFQTSSTNSVGLTVTPSNPSSGNEKLEVTGANYTGNAATATAPSLVQTGLLAQYTMPPSEVSTTTLTDYSGNGNNGTFPGGSANPTRNTYGGISCSAASSQFISLPAAINSAVTFMLVTYFDPNASGVTNRVNVLSPASGAGPTIFFSNTPTSVILWPSPNSLTGTGVWGMRGWNSATSLRGTDYAPVHGWQILTWSGTTTNDTLYHYNITESPGNGGANIGTLGSSNYQLCGSTAAGGHFFQGQILFAAFWNIALTPQQVAQNVAAVQAILQANDGIVLDGKPGGVTWRTPTSVVDNSTLLLYGDSVTAFVLNPNVPTISGLTNIFSAGFGGTYAGQMAKRAPYLIDVLLPNFGTGKPFTGLNVNDISFNSNGFNALKTAIIINFGTNTTGDGSVEGSVAGMAIQRRLAGWNKIARTTIVSNWNGGNHDANKNSINPVVRQRWSGYADVMLDLAAIPALGADGAFQNTTYSTSQIHPDTTISEQMFGQAYSYAYRRMYGNSITGIPNIATTSPYLVQPEDVFFETNTAGAISAYLIPAQFFTGQTVTVKNIGAGTLTVLPKPIDATITNLALTTNVITITAANNYTAGDVVVLNGLTTNPTLNGTSLIINSTGLSASSFQAALTHANIGSAAETGTATHANYCQIAAITNVSESAGNVVTLTIANNFANGSSVTISGVVTATWLNGQTVTLSAASGTSIQFTDGTAHGAYGPAADTGTVTFKYAAETINGLASLTVPPGSTASLLSIFTSNATGQAKWVTTQSSVPAANCAASGTAANPSVVSCGAASAGAVFCDVAASAGTCTINTTAVTANSRVFITPSTADGTELSQTCNTAMTFGTAPILSAKVAGTSFTINMPTVVTNGACFEYSIIN